MVELVRSDLYTRIETAGVAAHPLTLNSYYPPQSITRGCQRVSMNNMNLGRHGIGRQHLQQGGGRGTGNDHVSDLFGCTELYVYQTPNKKVTGLETLKLFVESEGCELIYTADAPPELSHYETLRITHRRAEKIPDAVVKRIHSWAHQRNYLHSFFKPLYR